VAIACGDDTPAVTARPAPQRPPPKAEAESTAGAPRQLRGYAVRGTDELSFRPCGSSRVYFVRARGEVAQRFIQRYRFSSTQLLSPVYFELEGYMLDDTISVGDSHYSLILDLRKVTLEPGKPACPQPSRGSFIRPR
jgi:hypothetical protein